VFGNTGIQALYDDANNIGAALIAAGDGSAIETYATQISEAFVQFAGQLALFKVNQVDNTDLDETAGVLTYAPDSGGNVLSIDFIDELWSAANNGTVPTMVARDDLVSAILAETGVQDGIRSFMDLLRDNQTSDTSELVR
jgi:hypothetical protein